MIIDGLYDRCYLVEYDEGDKALYRTPLYYTPSVNDTYHVVRDGDTLHSIAQQYYNSQYPWFIIADVNASLIDDIFELIVGTSLVIPNLQIIGLVYVRA